MSRNALSSAAAIAALLTLLVAPLAVTAHQEVNAGNYVVEYGWTNEPALVNQPNAVVINISAADTSGSAPAGVISIAAPANMAAVKGDKVDLTIKIDGIDPAMTDSVHWHLSVDGKVIAMVPASQTTVSISGLADGMHTVTATLASSDHGDIGQPVNTMITVSGSTASNGPMVDHVDALPAAGGGLADFKVDVSALKIEVDYGGQSKVLALQPLTDGRPGQYVAPFVPTRAGQYTVKLTGKLTGSAGDSDVNLSVNPEDVETIDAYAFPSVSSEPSASGSFGLTGWLAVGGLVAGLAGLALGGAAFMRKK